MKENDADFVPLMGQQNSEKENAIKDALNIPKGK